MHILLYVLVYVYMALFLHMLILNEQHNKALRGKENRKWSLRKSEIHVSHFPNTADDKLRPQVALVIPQLQ